MARSCNKGLLLKIPAEYYPSPRRESMPRGENLTQAGDHQRRGQHRIAMLPRAALLRIFRRGFFLHWHPPTQERSVIRLSRQLVLLQNEQELSQAGLKPGQCTELSSPHQQSSGIRWAFERAFWDETAGKLTLLYHDVEDARNEERCLTLRLERAGKTYRVAGHHIALP